MRGLHKSKRVSWASDVNLCQVRLFLSEESPSQVGLGPQDHLQAKSSFPAHSNGVVSDEFLPPGFEGTHPPNQSQIKLSEIPLIKWSCPTRFRLDLNWQVVAGDESKEVEIQNQREMRVLEAVYPRPSAIPPNPSIPADIEFEHYNDQQTPLIPITPIEDEEATADTPSGSVAPFSVPISSQPPLLPPGIPAPPQLNIFGVSNTSVNEKPAASGMTFDVDPEVVAAASAALNEMTKSNEHGNLIDHDLLIKILSNPNLIEKLVTDQGAASKMQNKPKPTLPSVSSDHPPLPSVPVTTDRPPFRVNMMETSSPSLAATSSGAFYTQPNGVGVGHPPNAWVKPPPGVIPSSSSVSCGVSQTKDMNYYKNLIQQHGGERQETPQTQQFGGRYIHHPGTNQELINNPKSRDSKPKIMKPCIYFNSARGCRHGANCAYQHDTSAQQRGSNMPEMQNAKRMKMDREISS
ncbi:zinc finger CCCH domain-containing protein 6 [Mangifera indica]|uniref:zinc finger CCCH domain-containing protein 6 n=1 Tax=Mangifera indica TaxID=29780 RepID=UPI001CF9B08D|nr:zinc finger CCCH domain-containing protein 6 [Mangifera indica]